MQTVLGVRSIRRQHIPFWLSDMAVADKTISGANACFKPAISLACCQVTTAGVMSELTTRFPPVAAAVDRNGAGPGAQKADSGCRWRTLRPYNAEAMLCANLHCAFDGPAAVQHLVSETLCTLRPVHYCCATWLRVCNTFKQVITDHWLDVHRQRLATLLTTAGQSMPR